eukprot:803241-Pyramimonas_sp.AAC.1
MSHWLDHVVNSVIDANITTTGNKVLDIFRIQNADGGKIPESGWDAIKAALHVVAVDMTDPVRLEIEDQQEKQWALTDELKGWLTMMLETVVTERDGEEVVLSANTLMDGFKQLGMDGSFEPRLHAELMRFIRDMDPGLLLKVITHVALTSHHRYTTAHYLHTTVTSPLHRAGYGD